MKLLDTLHAQHRDPSNVRGRTAQVVAVGPGSLTVDLDAGDDNVIPNVPTSALYRDAAVGDVVLVQVLGTAWLAALPLRRNSESIFPNVLRNPGFESDAIGVLPAAVASPSREDEPYAWGVYWVNAPGAGKLAITAADTQHSGSRCLRYTLTDGTDFWIVPETGVSPLDPEWPNVPEFPDPVPVSTGQVWRIGAWARASATLPAAATIRVGYDASAVDGLSVTWSLTSTLTTAWKWYQATYTVPAGVTRILPCYSVSAFSATGVTGKHVYLDDLVAQRVS